MLIDIFMSRLSGGYNIVIIHFWLPPCLWLFRNILFWLSFHLRCRVRSGKTVIAKKELTKTVYTLYGEDVRHILFTLSMYLYRQYALPLSIPRFRCGSQRGVFSCAFTIWTTLWIWKFLNGIYTFTRYTILCALLQANFSGLLIDLLPAPAFIQVLQALHFLTVRYHYWIKVTCQIGHGQKDFCLNPQYHIQILCSTFSGYKPDYLVINLSIGL